MTNRNRNAIVLIALVATILIAALIWRTLNYTRTLSDNAMSPQQEQTIRNPLENNNLPANQRNRMAEISVESSPAARCRALSEQEGVEYEYLSGTVLEVDLYPFDGMDCFDREHQRRAPCFDNNRVGMIKLELPKKGKELKALEIIAYTKPVHTKNFDKDFFIRLDRDKNYLSFCGQSPVPYFNFIPQDRQRDTPKYEVFSTDYIFVSPASKGE